LYEGTIKVETDNACREFMKENQANHKQRCEDMIDGATTCLVMAKDQVACILSEAEEFVQNI
jgi:hypothetical protein